MDLVNLNINNFGAIKEAKLNLFKKGLVSIEGENNDGKSSNSNGAGKSTIINAILWGNYGDAGKKMKADSVVNDKMKRDCRVESVWLDDEANLIYRIVRYRKHREHGNNVYVYRKEPSTGVEIDISRAGRANQALIDEILGADQQTFEAHCFARQKYAMDIPALSDRELKELLDRTLPFDNFAGYFDTVSKELNIAMQKLKDLEGELNKSKTLFDVHSEHGLKFLNLKRDFDSTQAKKKRDIVEEIEKLDEELASMDKSLSTTELTDKISKLEDALTRIPKFRPPTWILKDIDSVESEIEKLEEDLEFGIDINCPVCHSEMNKEQKEKVTDIKKNQLSNYRKKFNSLKKEYLSAHKYVSATQAIQDAIQEHNKTHREISLKLSKIEALKVKIKELNNKLKSLDLNPFINDLMDAKTKIVEYKALKEKQEKEIETLKEEISILEKVYDVFSPKGLRYHFLETMTPFLNSRTNYYLSQLTDNTIGAVWSTVKKMSTGDYKEKFSIQIKMRGITEYGALSGGEQRKVQLSCFFALQDLIASRATKKINIWCGDEIDHALDSNGLERLMGLLDEKTKSKSTILVISHNELRDWIPNFATVIRKDNFSYIEGYLSGS